ncbi:hypothetical protein ACLWBD_02185 [Bdellovibrio sp. HCB117]|uniref:hypothetical protein n=1 Tax=Bdellovibrio sp. HCB117 TaxID=3394359 RepID=UPI0039B4A355
MSWSKYFIALLAVVSFHSVQAQEAESAPQEPPFVQEDTEFDSEALSIEDEIQSAAPESALQPPQKETVNLNEEADPNKNLEEELSIKDEEPVVAEEPEVVPAPPSPVVEVKPTKPLQPGKVMRRSARGGTEYIEHPQAANGLIAITKEGAYIYRTKESGEYNHTGSFRLGLIDPPRIISADGTTSFDTMYSGSSQPLFMFDYEWQPFNGYGKFGIQAGFGFMIANGKGRFIEGDLVGQEAKESYTFLAVPLNLGLVYRLEWMDRQWFAPYVSGGGTYIGVAEFRDDGATPSAVGTPGAYGAAGLLINISAMDRETAFTLKSEYGISNLWVSLDYRYLQTFNEDLDFTSGIAGAGITVDY